ncbi:hypothetical protein FRB96_004928 [Tulasnella sp. 330]|nr:hypothetical protein FRB96_004928 [Tulasnella sp. 330]
MAPTKRRSGGKQTTKYTPTQSSHPPEYYVQSAETLIAQSDYSLAQKTLLVGLKAHPNDNSDMRLLLGVVEMELGDFPAAKQVLETLIPPSPTAPSLPSLDAYFYLAQFNEDPRAALRLYQSGVDLVVKALKGKGPALAGPDLSEDDLKKKAAKALTAMVGIWMTDLWQPEAEQQCETLLSHAQELDADNPEVLRTLASVRISQQRNDEARLLAERSWAGWKDLDPADINAPSTEDRLSLAKLFLELEAYPLSFAGVQSVLADNDQDVEAWYLQGLGYWEISNALAAGKVVAGVKETTTSREVMQIARNCLGTCKELMVGQNYPDDELRQQAEALILEMEKKGFRQTIDPDAALEAQLNMLEAAGEGDGDEDEDEWEDVDHEFEGIDDGHTDDIDMS